MRFVNRPRLVPELLRSSIPVGSRVTCNPAPKDTDADFLILCTQPEFDLLSEFADAHEWDSLGSDIPDEVNKVDPSKRFHSWRIGEKNYIVTTNDDFHKKFLLATAVVKACNIMEKWKRIVIFQAILYSNAPEEDWDMAAFNQLRDEG